MGLKMPATPPTEKSLSEPAKGDPNADKIEERKSAEDESVMAANPFPEKKEAEPEKAAPPEAPAPPEPNAQQAVAAVVPIEQRVGNMEEALKVINAQLAKVQEVMDEILSEEESPEVPVTEKPEQEVKTGGNTPETAGAIPEPAKTQASAGKSEMSAIMSKLESLEQQVAQFSMGKKKSLPSGQKAHEMSSGEIAFREYNNLV